MSAGFRPQGRKEGPDGIYFLLPSSVFEQSLRAAGSLLFLSCMQTGNWRRASPQEVAEVPLSGVLTSDDLIHPLTLSSLLNVFIYELQTHGASRAPLDPSPWPTPHKAISRKNPKPKGKCLKASEFFSCLPKKEPVFQHTPHRPSLPSYSSSPPSPRLLLFPPPLSLTRPSSSHCWVNESWPQKHPLK